MRASPGAGSGRALPAVYLAARREVLIRLRTRVFWTGTIVMTALVVAGILALSFLDHGSAAPRVVHVGFSAGSRGLEPSFQSFARALGETVTVTDVTDPASGRNGVRAGALDMAVFGSDTAPTALVSESIPAMVEIALDAAAQRTRLAATGLTQAAIDSAMAGVPFESVPASGSLLVIDQSVFAALAVAILLFVSIEIYGIQVAQGVVEEKASRIIEILLSTIRPAELLGGKILGIGLVGLLQLGIVAAAALVTGAITHRLSLPALGVGEVAAYLAWFLLGFLLYAAAYASIAALVSRPEEVNSATGPVTILFGACYVLMFFALPNPTSPWVTLLSFLPPAAPILMSMRIAEIGVPLWQIGLGMILTGGAIIAVIWFAGRMYANAAMRTGMRVPLREAFRG